MSRAKKLDASLLFVEKRLDYFRSLPLPPAMTTTSNPSQPSKPGSGAGLGSLELSGVKAISVATAAAAAAAAAAEVAGESQEGEKEARGGMDYGSMLEKCSGVKEISKK